MYVYIIHSYIYIYICRANNMKSCKLPSQIYKLCLHTHTHIYIYWHKLYVCDWCLRRLHVARSDLLTNKEACVLL